MAFLNDTYCQLCGRFIFEDHGNIHLFSKRHSHRKSQGYWTAYFPQSQLTMDEDSKIEKAFWEMLFATRDNKEVEEF